MECLPVWLWRSLLGDWVVAGVAKAGLVTDLVVVPSGFGQPARVMLWRWVILETVSARVCSTRARTVRWTALSSSFHFGSPLVWGRA